VSADAVVTKSNNAVTVKEYVRKTNQALVLHQYNPDEQLEAYLDDVVEVHAIVQIDEP
jgi:phage repressor protein C with HTH and peptisase S24 domain